MKLPIKKKWFDLIKKGEKPVEFRDAHITFICEETGETLQLKVKDAGVIEKELVPADARGVMEDDKVLWFHLDHPIKSEEKKK